MSRPPLFSGFVDLAALRAAGSRAARVERNGADARVTGPGVEVRVTGGANAASEDDCIVVAAGAPRVDAGGDDPNAQEPASRWLRAYRKQGDDCVRDARGPFAVVILDLQAGMAIGAVDRFAIRPLCYAVEGLRLAFSDRADAVPLRGAREIDPQALFDYLYFHVIPAPRTVFRGVSRLENGHALRFAGERAEAYAHWVPRFAEDGAGSVASLKDEFRTLVRDAVARESVGSAAGAFLSGGTDSSTVAGMLGAVTGQPAKTYSIGFDAEGYDEMAFARIAAQHFRTDHHEYYVTPDDVLQGIPLVAAHYDQPFGNSSAVPAYWCALKAREDGVARLLAGDGGDELFGGNARYAKQRVFGAYEALPAALRREVLEPLAGGSAVRRMPMVRKAASYVEQARVPMPDRLQTYNLLERLGVGEVLTPQFLGRVDPGDPLAQQRRVYGASTAHSLVNRMLEYDWKYTLADNDLPKVCGTTALAGVSVGFPLLDDALVDFSLRLAPALKLKGLRLRYFFKEALRGFLPDAILTKRKHGFGLPFGVWLARHPALRDFALKSLARLAERNVVRTDFLAALGGERLRERPGYYGEMIWILLMLEHWLERQAPGYAVER